MLTHRALVDRRDGQPDKCLGRGWRLPADDQTAHVCLTLAILVDIAVRANPELLLLFDTRIVGVEALASATSGARPVLEHRAAVACSLDDAVTDVSSVLRLHIPGAKPEVKAVPLRVGGARRWRVARGGLSARAGARLGEGSLRAEERECGNCQSYCCFHQSIPSSLVVPKIRRAKQ